MVSWVVEEWNGRESNHFYSSCQVAWGFFNKFSKQTLLSSSFDSLRSLNVFISLPRHLTSLLFTLLLVMAICGAQGRIWRIRHTCITYIAKSKTGSKEKLGHTIRSRCARVWIVVDEMETPFVWSLSLYKFFLRAWLSFFSFFFMDLHVSIFFLDSPCLFFSTKTGERDQHI